MPQIQEYLPETQAQGPIGGTSPNIELAGAVGRGIENLGAQLENSGQFLHRREAQQETADEYANAADRRAQYTERVRQETQNGTLDVDKVLQDYDDETSSAGENLSTPEGKNYFERQTARTRAQILRNAQAGAGQVAANDARASYKTAIDTNSATLTRDPSPDHFKDMLDQGQETVGDLVKNGGLPAKMQGQALQEMGTQYSKAYISGLAQVNPEQARKDLDSPLFDSYLNADQRHQMSLEIDRYAAAKETEDRRTDRSVELARKAAQEKFGQDALPKLVNNALSTKDVLSAVQSGTLDWEHGERWLNMIKEGAKQDVKTDPRVKNGLIQRIVDPNNTNPIEGPEDLMRYVGKGISIADFNSMNSLFNKTPEGQATQLGEKALFQSAKSIRFKNPMTNQYDVLGEQKYAQFMNDYVQAKKTAKANNISPSDLVNPNSPVYFGKSLESYQTPLQEQLSHVSQDRTDKALGLKRTGPDAPPAQPTDKNVRKPNESAADYLKRRGLGG